MGCSAAKNLTVALPDGASVASDCEKNGDLPKKSEPWKESETELLKSSAVNNVQKTRTLHSNK